MNSGSLGQAKNIPGQNIHRYALFSLVLTALLVRLVHLASAVDSPFSYHLGPDEDYYLNFGRWIAGIAAGEPAEFAFMDPAYGYVLGLWFKLFGPNRFSFLFLQAALDTLTTLCIFLIGRELGRPRAGFFGALVYALTATAILYTATFLKATWVANALVMWTLFGLVLLRTPKAWPWLLFGVFCGYCVALRSNLLLLAGLSLLLLPWLYWRNPANQAGLKQRAALLGLGLLVPLIVLSMRNYEFSGKISPLPNNGGTVLHQVYNADNPRAESWYPAFAPYTHPTEILRGYAREAERISARSMTPGEVDAYWRSEAIGFIRSEPGSTAANLGRKAFEFAAHTEVANNRSLVEERMFSSVLGTLPSPFGWLFAFGIPGLALLAWRDRRGYLAAGPVLIVLATFAVFFAEARFRFHAVPLLALGVGLFTEDFISWFRKRQVRHVIIGATAALLLAGMSAWATRLVPAPVVSWDSILWGYIKMGDLPAAQETAENNPSLAGSSAKWEEALGFLAWSRQDHTTAAGHYKRAVDLNPGSHVAHYNLAMMLATTGDVEKAIQHVNIALEIAPLPEYRLLLESMTGPQ